MRGFLLGQIGGGGPVRLAVRRHEIERAAIADAPRISALIRELSKPFLVSPAGEGAEPFFAAIVSVLLPAIFIVVMRRGRSNSDLPVVAAGLLVVLPAFLLACVPFGTFNNDEHTLKAGVNYRFNLGSTAARY